MSDIRVWLVGHLTLQTRLFSGNNDQCSKTCKAVARGSKICQYEFGEKLMLQSCLQKCSQRRINNHVSFPITPVWFFFSCWHQPIPLILVAVQEIAYLSLNLTCLLAPSSCCRCLYIQTKDWLWIQGSVVHNYQYLAGYC